MFQDFSLCIGTAFVFGHDAERHIGAELASRDCSKVLIHHENGDYLTRSGLLETVKGDLREAGVDYVELSGVQPNPRLSLVRTGIELARRNAVDAVLAIGGGSVIDSAKAIALGACMDGDVWNCFTGTARPHSTLPVAVILTNPASGSESSGVSVINNEEEHSKRLVSDPLIRPVLALMNPRITCSVPAFPTACGIVDMFSHICERYFTADVEFGVIDHMAEGALRTLVDLAPRCLGDLTNYEYRAQIMWISTIAQNNMLGVGREQDWATHTIANELSALYDIPHGATLSIIMGSWMRQVYAANPHRFARYAREVFGICNESMDLEELAVQGIVATEGFFCSLGMPVSFHDFEVPTDGVERMLDALPFNGPGRTIGSVSRLDRDACRNIYRDAFQS